MARNRIPKNENSGDAERLERRARQAAPPGQPPADLLARCLSDAPRELSPKAAAWLEGSKANASEPAESLVIGDSKPVNGKHLNGKHVAEKHVNGTRHAQAEPVRASSSGRPAWLLPLCAAAGLVAMVGAGLLLLPDSNSVAHNKQGTDTVVKNNDVKKNDIKLPPVDFAKNNTTNKNNTKQNVVPENPVVRAPDDVPAPIREEDRPPLGTPEALVKAQLAAGEFAPAVKTARKIERMEVRDEWLGQIAVAQAGAGQRGQAIDTVRQISDDRSRAGALSRIPAATGSGRLGAGGAFGGGGAQADFDSLIDLITSTVAPQSWDEVGGRGSVQPFPTGVYIDPAGVLRRELKVDVWEQLRQIHAAGLQGAASGPASARRDSTLRKVSLTRLEREAQLRRFTGMSVDEDMMYMAGLQRIEYVLVYPGENGQVGDIVLAGPAGDWKPSTDGRVVGAKSGRPVLQLDDLVVMLRHLSAHPNAPFGCLIAPRAENLARFKHDHETNGKKALAATTAARDKRLEELRTMLGRQDIQVYGGLDPQTRVARVLVEADYRMKLVGIGLEEGTLNIPSCLELFKKKVAAGEAPPALDVLRLWFTLNYQSILSTPDRQAFNLRGPGVQVLSENQFLTDQGQRLPTGQSDPLYQEFASNFSRHFEALAVKYPVYADLQNLCDLALVSALIESQGLADQTNWHRTYFGVDAGKDGFARHEVALGPAPTEVDSVANYVELNRRQITFIVSGGVRVDPWKHTESVQVDKQGKVESQYRGSAPNYQKMPAESWWWD
jgi:hypothetical protein